MNFLKQMWIKCQFESNVMFAMIAKILHFNAANAKNLQYVFYFSDRKSGHLKRNTREFLVKICVKLTTKPAKNVFFEVFFILMEGNTVEQCHLFIKKCRLKAFSLPQMKIIKAWM